MVVNQDGCLVQTLDEIREFGYIVADAAIQSAGEEGAGSPGHFAHAYAAVDGIVAAIPGAGVKQDDDEGQEAADDD